MPETNISNAEVGDYKSKETEFSVNSKDTDGATEQKDNEWQNTEWTEQFGYYTEIAELRKAIDAKATWTIGKGFQANEVTSMALMTIKGHGKDTFNTILENMVRVADIGGDSYAEIIRDDDKVLVNLKPLNPGSMKIKFNSKGIIIGYEQTSRVKGKASKKWKPEQIFHLSRNRAADEIHGKSVITALKSTIDAWNEAMKTQRVIIRRFAKPLMIFHLDTDDPAEIADYKAKNDEAWADGEPFYVPKGVVVPEAVTIASNATLNALPWIQQLENSFWKAVGVPQIIVGGSNELTEATAKILYLAFEQTIEEIQLYIEEQVLSQLNLEIELEFPASLESDLISDKQKGESMQAATPEDTSVKNTGIESGAGAK